MAKKSVKKSTKPKVKRTLEKESEVRTPKQKAQPPSPKNEPRFYEETEQYKKFAGRTLRQTINLAKSWAFRLPDDFSERIWKKGGSDYLFRKGKSLGVNDLEIAVFPWKFSRGFTLLRLVWRGDR